MDSIILRTRIVSAIIVAALIWTVLYQNAQSTVVDDGRLNSGQNIRESIDLSTQSFPTNWHRPGRVHIGALSYDGPITY